MAGGYTNHSNASGKAYKDQTVAQLALVGKKGPSERKLLHLSLLVVSPSQLFQTSQRNEVWIVAYHQEGRDDPVHHYAEANLLPHIPVREELVQALVSHLAQDWVHHDEQADRWTRQLLSEPEIGRLGATVNRVLFSPTGTETPTNFPFCSAGPT